MKDKAASYQDLRVEADILPIKVVRRSIMKGHFECDKPLIRKVDGKVSRPAVGKRTISKFESRFRAKLEALILP